MMTQGSRARRVPREAKQTLTRRSMVREGKGGNTGKGREQHEEIWQQKGKAETAEIMQREGP
eukprot:780075-Pleurochrysis_carterae.AAC.1